MGRPSPANIPRMLGSATELHRPRLLSLSVGRSAGSVRFGYDCFAWGAGLRDVSEPVFSFARIGRAGGAQRNPPLMQIASLYVRWRVALRSTRPTDRGN